MTGLLVLDKPSGWTSHDVVARVRRLAGTKRVGHAGTLDPMATGVLVLGIGQATRLLGHLTLHEKTYDATVRLGIRTTTDDAEGEVVATGPLPADLAAAVAALVGPQQQVPPAYSAISVGGVRSYARARRGDAVDLPARAVVVHALEILDVRLPDVDLRVRCSAGTYVRAIARDLGGHLTALRRTASGPYALPAPALDDVDRDGVGPYLVPIADAARAAFPSVVVDEADARRVSTGVRIGSDLAYGPVAVYDESGALLALAEPAEGRLAYLAVFTETSPGIS